MIILGEVVGEGKRATRSQRCVEGGAVTLATHDHFGGD